MGEAFPEPVTTVPPFWRAPWRLRVRDWISDRLTPEEAAAFADENAERDVRRARLLAPLMMALHLGHIAVFWVPESLRPTMAPTLLLWRDELLLVHAATLPLAALQTVVALRWPASWMGRNIMLIAAVGYLVHGALVTGVDQLTLGNVSAFSGYCFGVAVICSFPLRTASWVYGIGFALVASLLAVLQPDPVTRFSNLLNVTTTVTVSLAVSTLLSIARQRDFRQRLTIARQRDELAGLNNDLERRVSEQVAEIVRRAEEVSQLNAQLRSQIRARSSELSLALSKLAKQRGEDGLLCAGALLGDRFEIGDTIGSGGMGVVYSGRDRITGSTVAIKVIQATSSTELDAMRRFLGEASAVAAITHPAVVRMIHVDISEEGFLYQAQELVEGQTLEQRLQDGPWPEASVARFGAVLFDALAAAHVHGVIHRDIKPANVMLIDEAPGLKLLDFGLAKLYDRVSPVDQTRTGIGLVVGTPAYMAPEQALALEVTDRADVYAGAVLIFQLLTGRHVFELEGASRVMRSHVTADAPDVRTLRAEVADEVAALIATCLAKEPEARPSAAEVSRRLGEFADAHGAPPLEELLRRSAADAVLRRFH